MEKKQVSERRNEDISSAASFSPPQTPQTNPLDLQKQTFSDVAASVMKNLFAPRSAETLALLMLRPRFCSAATVSSSSPSLSPNLTVTTVAKESEVLSMTTSGVGTAEAEAEEGASVAGVAL